MKKILNEWRQFEEEILSEKRAQLRFKNFVGKRAQAPSGKDKVQSDPENQIQKITSSRQWKIYKKKIIEAMRRAAEKKAKQADIDFDRYKDIVNFEEVIEKYEQALETNAKSALGTVSSGEFLDKVVGHTKSSKAMYKIQKNGIQKLNNFVEHYIDKFVGDGVHDPQSTRDHEAIHFHLKQIKNAFGEKVYQTLLKSLMSIFGKGKEGSVYDLVDRYLMDSGSLSYDEADPYDITEEVLAWSYQFLTDSRKRRSFKRFLHKKLNIDSRKVMNKLKSIWKKSVKYAANVEPEDLEGTI